MWWRRLYREVKRGSWWDVQIELECSRRHAIRMKGGEVEPVEPSHDPVIQAQRVQAESMLRSMLNL